MGENDIVIDTLNTDFPFLGNSLSSIDPCDNPALTYKTAKFLDFLEDDYVNYARADFTNVGAIERRTECDLITAIQKNEIVQLSIYPNPCKNCGVVSILSNENLASTPCEVFDYTGKLVKVGMISNDNKFDVSNLSQGVYFLSTRVEDNHYSISKFVILE